MKPSRFVLLLLAFGLSCLSRHRRRPAPRPSPASSPTRAAPPVPGATVTATNQATNVDYTAMSNDAGNYTITSLPVGAYVVKAELAGFKTAATKPIHAGGASRSAGMDFKMELGALEETVEVSSESPVLQTEIGNGRRGHLGHDAAAAAAERPQHRPALTPAARRRHAEPEHLHRRRATSAAAGPYVNGNREQTNNYTIDGVDMNESIDNLVAYQPSPDALAEISVETNNYARRHRQRGRRRDQQRDQVGNERVPRQRLRVLPQQRHGRELVGEQPLARGEAGAHAAHLRRHARRPDRQEQVVLLRQLPGDAVQTRPGSRRSRWRPKPGAAATFRA